MLGSKGCGRRGGGCGLGWSSNPVENNNKKSGDGGYGGRCRSSSGGGTPLQAQSSYAEQVRCGVWGRAQLSTGGFSPLCVCVPLHELVPRWRWMPHASDLEKRLSYPLSTLFPLPSWVSSSSSGQPTLGELRWEKRGWAKRGQKVVEAANKSQHPVPRTSFLLPHVSTTTITAGLTLQPLGEQSF